MLVSWTPRWAANALCPWSFTQCLNAMLPSISTYFSHHQREPVLVVQEDHTCIDLATDALRLLMTLGVDIAYKAVLGFIGGRDSLFVSNGVTVIADPKISSCTNLHGARDALECAGSEGRFLCAAISTPAPFADLDVIQDALFLLLGYTWTHVRLGVYAIIHH